MNSVHKRVHISAAKTQIEAIATALELFKKDNGHYPKNLDDLVVQPLDTKNWSQGVYSIPLDPWQHPYLYVCPGKINTNLYDLSSAGPDGRVGTEDDIIHQQKNQ